VIAIAEIFKFPYDACRRVHSRKPRRSKNGTPDERAAKAAAEIAASPPAEVVPPSAAMVATSAEKVDRRKLRGSPLRDKVPTISFAVTIVGKLHMADLRGESWPSDAAGWLAELHKGSAAAPFVADELDRAAERLRQHQTELL
jgi:hypothetical protein